MRILSQDNGKYDLPYENIVLEKMMDCNTIYAYTGTGQPFKMAVYSSSKKMSKAMEMLRETYMVHFQYKTMTAEQKAVFINCTDEKEQEKICGVFQFPYDDEVEV